jgi:hypothetical protein
MKFKKSYQPFNTHVMNNKSFSQLFLSLALITFGCSQDDVVPKDQTLMDPSVSGRSVDSQISGIGYLATATECDFPAQNATYALKMTGELEGCLFIFVDERECSPSGTYRHVGREYFVGTYKGGSGTFWSTFRFEGKFEGCDNGAFVGAEIFGRCQHPIVDGSGEGVFEGVRGRLDFKDDVELVNFPYRGHLLF